MTSPASSSAYKPENLPVVIFCGGQGTRLKEETGVIPKPLVGIGERPILWHIMKIFYAQGFRRFVLLVGYKGEQIKHYFYDYPIHMSDFTVRHVNGAREMTFHNAPEEQWEVTVLDTGLTPETGGRLLRARSLLEQGPFMLTYGDGVADVDLQKLLAFHAEHLPTATITGVHPPGRFGEIKTDGPFAEYFLEKPQTGDVHINGGFMVMEPNIFSYMNGSDRLNFEKDVLPSVAKERKMAVYPHHGFWQCMDTLRDMEMLNTLWKRGDAPWKIWKS
jgi:glucose-1-phosphate cytidylyltransferase